MPTKTLIACSQTACSAPGGGPCLEGESPGTCKYAKYSEVAEDDQTVEVASTAILSPLAGFRHLSGEEMGLSEINKILCNALTRVVVVAGQPSSGKTTLLTSIYEAFNKGPYAGYLFSWCHTFPAYEQRCFPSRVVSERLVADTDRTLLGQPKFLHWRVRDQGLVTKAQDIVFADIAGEVFANGQVSSSEIETLAFLARADHLAILVDGAKLADPKQRHTEANNCRTLLRSLMDNGIVSDRQFVQILFSRWDLVLESRQEKSVEVVISDLSEELTRQFGMRLGELTFAKIASRPQTEVLVERFNVEPLFKTWVGTSSLLNATWLLPQPEDTGLRTWLLNGED